MRKSDITRWPWIISGLTILVVGMDLASGDTKHLAWALAGLLIFGAFYPAWLWTKKLPIDAQAGLILFEAALITAGLFCTGRPKTAVVLFFVLVPTCARLPRHFSLLGYVLFPLVACLPFIFAPSGTSDWGIVVNLVLTFLVIIGFTESFTQLARRSEETQKLLDELVAAQKRIQARETAATPDAANAATPAGAGGDAVTGPADPAGASGAAAHGKAGTGISFTRRERDVLALVAMGFSNKEIADRLFLAEGTVKNKVSAILEKTGVRDRTQAALRARELGVV
jgi:DNA-binding CsgD family transcriptional regulator